MILTLGLVPLHHMNVCRWSLMIKFMAYLLLFTVACIAIAYIALQLFYFAAILAAIVGATFIFMSGTKLTKLLRNIKQDYDNA